MDDELHQRMATLRGVEGGFTVARAAQQGLLTVTDARGRLVTRAGRGDEADASLIAEMRARGGGTPYSRLGDSIAWACGLGALALLGAAEVGGRWRPERQLAIEPTRLDEYFPVATTGCGPGHSVTARRVTGFSVSSYLTYSCLMPSTYP